MRVVHPQQGLIPRPPSTRATVAVAGIVGIVGGIYGIGGGSLLGPILAGRGLPLAKVAPAALTSTFVTSMVGAATFTTLALTTDGAVSPDWPSAWPADSGDSVAVTSERAYNPTSQRQPSDSSSEPLPSQSADSTQSKP